MSNNFSDCWEKWRDRWGAGRAFFYLFHLILNSWNRQSTFAKLCQPEVWQLVKKCWRCVLIHFPFHRSWSAESSSNETHNKRLTSSILFQAVLSASPELSQEDLQRFTQGLSPQWDLECDQLLHTAVSHLAERDEPKGHMVLILDKVGFLFFYNSTCIQRFQFSCAP